MQIEFKIEGLDGLEKKNQAVQDRLPRERRIALKEGLNDIADYAGHNHRYTARSGLLDKAYSVVVNQIGTEGYCLLTKYVSNTPYAYRIHEGFRQADSLGRQFNQAPDRFLYKAGKARGPALVRRMDEAYKRALRGF